MTLSPDQLLAGARGRRLCLEFALHQGDESNGIAAELRQAVFYASYELDPGKGRSVVMMSSTVARLIDAVPLAEPDQHLLLVALAASVDSARYWQEPNGSDALAATPAVFVALRRVAAIIVTAQPANWWWESMDHTEQWKVTFTETASFAPPAPTSAAQALSRWNTAQRDEERDAARDRPADPTANWSGTWWSKPPFALTHTTRALAGHGPAGLLFVEDALGWQSATVARIDVPHTARIYEIDGPDAWAELCRRYPMSVTASRRHDWYRTTGRSGEWLVPDWSTVQQDFDAVHLTVGGYLVTAGRAIDVDEHHSTVLAGWNPDQTYWLRDVVRDGSDLQNWIYSSDSERWTTGDQ